VRGLVARVKEAFAGFGRHKVPRLAAALAFFTLISLAPLLVVLVAVVGLVLGNDQAREQVVSQLTAAVGPQATDLIEGLIDRTRLGRSGLVATVVSVVTLLAGATGVFVQLQGALNAIWEVEPERQGWRRTLLMRLEGLLILLGLGLAALVAVALNAAVNVIARGFAGLLPGAGWLWWVGNQVATFAIFALVFAALYRLVPDVRLTWRDVWGGALFTAALYKVGEVALAYYLGTAGVGSPYGAAGSLVVLLLFVFYAAQILLFGAEFTRADVAIRRGAGEGGAEQRRGRGWTEPAVRARGSLKEL